jgi:hypothetical protein
MRRWLASIAIVAAGAAGAAQEMPLEYRVKAAYLFNFLKYVEWPVADASRPLVLCVAGRNPFGDVLLETISGERIADREVTARTITEPDAGCDAIFVPRDTMAAPYLRAAPGALTVGEAPDFLVNGGIILFVQDGRNVRFQISEDQASRAGLRISSRLLRLSRTPTTTR